VLVVVVNGLPGAGKTTLARPLSRALGLPLLAKDVLKETLADNLPGKCGCDADPEAARAWSRRLGAASSEAMWAMLADCPRGAVLEQPLLADTRRFALDGLIRAGVNPETTHEVWCDVPVAVAEARYRARVSGRHPVHVDTREYLDADWSRWRSVAEPLGFGEVHRVDTTVPVDVPALAAKIVKAARTDIACC
jgi:predicted kinase